jgi:catechol 2,3-dioxygenase-like lactoylglutathione lyase family enzyme
MRVDSLDHIYIDGRDADLSAAFYREHFGATEVTQYG